jgi:hypothetical protein
VQCSFGDGYTLARIQFDSPVFKVNQQLAIDDVEELV